VPTALVTGATGLVGSHLVERLSVAGWRIRGLVRNRSNGARRSPNDWDGVAWLRAQGVDLVAGDILDSPTFTEAAQGCEVIFHTAAAVTPRTGRIHPYDAYRIPNVNGALNAVAAAERTGARLLQLSSVAVYGPESRYAQAPGRTVNETTPLEPIPERAYYSRSKRESEAIVLAAHAAGRIWATAVRPDVIYGRRDRQFVPRVARLARLGLIPLVGGGITTLAIVHAANVADGAFLAATTERAGGKAYNLANDFDVTVREFFRLAGDGLDQRMHFFSVPIGAARVGLKIVKRGLRLATGGRLSVISTASIDFVAKNNPFSSERARRELGWNPGTRPEHGVPEAFRWWKEHHR
jgi:nucleoside-diphosphate-sugar epimerase